MSQLTALIAQARAELSVQIRWRLALSRSRLHCTAHQLGRHVHSHGAAMILRIHKPSYSQPLGRRM